MSGRVLHLSETLAAQVRAAAARAYPNECCGLIEGMDTDDGWQALVVHESVNVAADTTRHYMIDPQMQFDLIRRLRDTNRRIVGCFHSHPGGTPELSATDKSQAYESNFLYLIAAGTPDTGFILKVYESNAAGKSFAKVALIG